MHAAASLTRRALEANRPLAPLGLLMLATLGAALVGLALDPRVITGQPAWLKPAKFAISIVFYSFSLLWLLGFVQGRRRVVRAVSIVTAVSLAVEMVVIPPPRARRRPPGRARLDASGAYTGLVLLLTWQALRGQPLTAPNATTVAALVGLVAATGLAAAAVLLHARRPAALLAGPRLARS